MCVCNVAKGIELYRRFLPISLLRSSLNGSTFFNVNGVFFFSLLLLLNTPLDVSRASGFFLMLHAKCLPISITHLSNWSQNYETYRMNGARKVKAKNKANICYSENWKCSCWFEIQDVYMRDWPSDLAKESHATECEYFNEIIYLWVLCRCLDQHMGYHRPKHTVKNIDNTQIAWS